MDELLSALALILVVEGLLYAAFPEAMRRMVMQVIALPPAKLRRTGLTVAVIGLGALWLMRG